MSGIVTSRVEGATAIIELNRPPVNTIDHDFLDALLRALRQAGGDPDVRAIVITSTVPGLFCGGLDLKIISGMTGDRFRGVLQKLYIDLFDVQHDLGKPTIAAVNGAARGGGMTIAVSCNVIVAEEQTTLGYSEVLIGLVPGIHFVHLPRQIGRHKAFELLFGAEAISATEAERLGLINRVVREGGGLDAALELADRFAAVSPQVIRRGREAFMRINDLNYRAEIARVVDDMCALVDTPESQEGLRAFVEKRKPDW